MPAFVLDCSMTIAWFIEDERSPDADAVLDRTAQEGALVPANWSLEVAQALSSARRRGRMTSDQVASALEILDHLPIHDDPQTADRAWRETLALAESQGLSVYDAAYLELAVRSGLALATRDRSLAAAAERCGVPVR